ncbi:hypothetical protein CCHR01_04520 [Colletotrichum chrysophilum]|uniref:Uncharacterized protein n=1 Tax=Colletotrichum chrysophilum TaxID=1836956 RepID=A0AAD9AUC3_9PEZI|nr:hypothetical protein CCHR01_04520 [Colletotrichum chrysophilum]
MSLPCLIDVASVKTPPPSVTSLPHLPLPLTPPPICPG